MVKSRSGDGTSSVAPFLLKCYEIVDDESNKDIVSWSATDNSFIIFDETQFSLKLLPKYWKHNNFSSFIRQLNIYGFRKVDTDRWEFANEGFIRGQKHLLRNITRRKNSLGLDQRKSSEQEKPDIACKENENLELLKEVENLKIDRNALRQELVKLRLQQDTADNRLVVLRESLQGMETNQQQMMSFIVMAMQDPDFFVQLLQPIEHNWRPAEVCKKNILQEVIDDGENLRSDGMIVKYQPPLDKTLHALLPSPPGPDISMDFDIPDGMKEFLANSELMQTMLDENDSLANPSPLILPDLQDDGLLDQLLFGSQYLGNIADNYMDSQEAAAAKMESSQMAIHGEQVENREATATQIETEKSLNMDLLIEQVGHLTSDTIQEDIEKTRSQD